MYNSLELYIKNYTMICIKFCGEPCKVLNSHHNAMVELKGKTMMVIVKGKGQEMNFFPFRPCDANKDSSWRPQSIVKNPKVLMHIGGRIRHFDGVLFAGRSCSTNTFGLQLFDLTPLVPVK